MGFGLWLDVKFVSRTSGSSNNVTIQSTCKFWMAENRWNPLLNNRFLSFRPIFYRERSLHGPGFHLRQLPWAKVPGRRISYTTPDCVCTSHSVTTHYTLRDGWRRVRVSSHAPPVDSQSGKGWGYNCMYRLKRETKRLIIVGTTVYF